MGVRSVALELSKRARLGGVFVSFGFFTYIVASILLVALIVVLLMGFEHRRASLRKLSGS
jgi:hypothetical protein